MAYYLTRQKSLYYLFILGIFADWVFQLKRLYGKYGY
jgi:hypothetical protein